MKVKLTSVQRYTTKKDGSPLVSSTGKPYTSIRIKTQEHGDKLLSGFGNKDNASWNVGDEVEIDVEQKGEYLNFSTPKKTGGMSPDMELRLGIACDDISAVRKNLMELGRALLDAGVIKRPTSKVYGFDYPERNETNDMHPLDEGINPEDVPF